MTIPGEVTLDEMKLLLERAHKGEIIPLYVFLRADAVVESCEYWARRLDEKSDLMENKGVSRLAYSSRVGGHPRNTGLLRSLEGFLIFTNYWYAYVYTIKKSGRAPVAINID